MQRDKQSYDKLKATDGDNDLDSNSPDRFEEGMAAAICQKEKHRTQQ